MRACAGCAQSPRLMKSCTPNDYMVQAYTKGTPPDEWFTLEILTRGSEVIVRVNGKKTAQLDKLAESVHQVGAKGFLVLEAAGDDTVIHIRKIEIKEVAAAAPALLAKWGEVVNPGSVTQINIDQAGRLDLVVPNVELLPRTKQDAPRVLQEVDGDF